MLLQWLAALEALLDKAAFGAQSDRLILLGDLIDRGPDSYHVLKKALALRADMGERFVCLVGNHEDLAINTVDTGDQCL